MITVRERWGDLGVRIASALVMVIIALAALLAGTTPFIILVVAITFVGIYELLMMGRHKLAQTGEFYFPDVFLLSGYAFLLCLGALGLVIMRLAYGVPGVVSLVALVVMTDTLGYFVGRTIGGPKFWPRVSPKKTWSGVVGGWCGAAFVGLAVIVFMKVSVPLTMAVFMAVVLSFTSQLGDIAESAVKRRMGVKDSSNIIPGHGGVLDRFDALLAVSAVLGLAILFG